MTTWARLGHCHCDTEWRLKTPEYVHEYARLLRVRRIGARPSSFPFPLGRLNGSQVVLAAATSALKNHPRAKKHESATLVDCDRGSVAAPLAVTNCEKASPSGPNEKTLGAAKSHKTEGYSSVSISICDLRPDAFALVVDIDRYDNLVHAIVGFNDSALFSLRMCSNKPIL